jgi:HEAT repeat protein
LRDHTADDRAVKDMFNQDVKDPKAIRVLGSHLSDPNPCLRRTAAQLLGGSNNDEALRTLREAMKSSDGKLREAAVLGLGHAEDMGSFDALTKSLRDPDNDVARMSAWALGEIEDAKAIPPLVDALKTQNAGLRHAAIWALGQIEDPKAVDPLLPMLKSQDTETRRTGGRGVGRHRRRSGNRWSHGNSWRRPMSKCGLAVVQGLGDIEDKKATRPLLKLLNDSDPDVRQATAEALGQH